MDMSWKGLRAAIDKAMARVVEPGNINIDNRKVVLNPDGTFSTEESLSYQGEDGSETLIPTVINGRHMTPEMAIEFAERSGQHLGKFTDPQAAEMYAEILHKRQERKYSEVAKALMARQ